MLQLAAWTQRFTWEIFISRREYLWSVPFEYGSTLYPLVKSSHPLRRDSLGSGRRLKADWANLGTGPALEKDELIPIH